ncbi:hypothetical protein MATR_37540 [Marivirga tractuosa]|uniref:Uncharacterized protein n=1 Tax=Marivirga tractuosa (strain ATCC 23168 / DSM 4126 / NBRC 15989 / NCIMB 1408 / VKM B-1430 / H-43) TaxID=643867 RepID=E4TME1_MARTH|nr:hypothetical protein [Marivirga tractuosa]ADR22400.1 hypothetical protein Ftrac_2422 [Marivirga tractuosa DSM 4126]BDD16929.1 hypothetical protein MATR_37540 [Marivirga tractuosa]
MKFFLVISIIAFWWVPMNSPGNIGISSHPLSGKLFQPKNEKSLTGTGNQNTVTKRKMDHFGFQNRRHLLRNKLY